MGVKIGIIGAMRSGKDTFAEPLIKQRDLFELKFSGGISAIIEDFFPETLNQGKPRKYYQHIGQSLRELNPDVWVNYLDAECRWAQEFVTENFIITDVRQPNEVQWCRDNGFTLVKIVTDDSIRRERIEACGDQFEPEQFYHETELYVDEVEADIYVDGNCSKEELQQKALEIYGQLKQEETE